jgi:hypothetical protein
VGIYSGAAVQRHYAIEGGRRARGSGNRTRVRCIRFVLSGGAWATVRQSFGPSSTGRLHWGAARRRRPSRHSERPNLVREINARRGVHRAPNPPSPVRIPWTSTAKTPRIRVNFSDHRQIHRRSLCLRRLNGGGGSLSRTRLWTASLFCTGRTRKRCGSELLTDLNGLASSMPSTSTSPT